MNSTKFWKLCVLLIAAPLFAGCDSNSGGGGGGGTPVSRVLTVSVSGSGAVTSTPAGLINCTQADAPDSPNCSEDFSTIQSVTLTATPGANFVFRAWAGACTSTDGNTCTFVSDRDRTIVAVFESTTGGLGGNAFGITSVGELFRFDPTTPSGASTPTAITGLQVGDTLVGIDFRPANGVMYGVTKNAANEGRLYVINEDTSGATLVGTLAAAAGDDNPYAALSGSAFGVDFAPPVVSPVPPLAATSDMLRVVSDTGQNLRINPANGAVTTDSALNPGTPAVTAIAHTNSFVSTGSTTLYAVDSTANKLYSQAGNSGTLTEVGSLNIVGSASNGFDIDAVSGLAVLVTTESTQRRLYSVNVLTGQATLVDAFPIGTDIVGIAIETPGTPEVFAIRETSPQALVRFAPLTPGSIVVVGNITSLQPSELIVALSVRQTDGALFALSSAGQVYELNTFTAAPTAVPGSAVAPFPGGTRFGTSFEPGSDIMRLVATPGESVRINLGDGSETADPDLGRPPFAITASAYDTDSQDTIQYVIDTIGDRLLKLTDEPGIFADGQLTSVGTLGVSVNELNGFDIVGTANSAYAAFGAGPTTSSLYTIDLSTGHATLVGAINAGERVRGIAMQPADNPAENSDVWAVTETTPRLISFPRDNPAGALTSNRLIAGLNGNVVGLEFRAADETSVVYALTDTSNICKITIGGLTPGTATCAAIGDGSGGNYTLQGASFGFDYDEVQGIFRIVSDVAETLNVSATPTLSPTVFIATDEGPITENPDLFVQALAHTNTFPGSTSTMYVIDTVNAAVNATLKTVPNPTGDGLVSDVGSLGLRLVAQPASLDILGGHNGLVLAALRVTPVPPNMPNGFSTLYRIDLSTGAVQRLDDIGPDPLTPASETRIIVGSMAVRFPLQ